MGKAYVLHRVTVGRTREVRGPDALERGFVGVVIAVVITMAVGFGAHLVHIAQAVEAVSVAAYPRTNEVVYHAVHGRWPSPDNQDMTTPGTQGRYVESTTLTPGGVITAEMKLGTVRMNWLTFAATHAGKTTRGRVTFRPELLGSKDTPTITFLCGYANPVAGQVAPLGVNTTTLAREDLPPFCR